MREKTRRILAFLCAVCLIASGEGRLSLTALAAVVRTAAYNVDTAADPAYDMADADAGSAPEAADTGSMPADVDAPDVSPDVGGSAGNPDGTTDSTPAGNPDGTNVGTPDGTTDGTPAGTPDGIPDSTVLSKSVLTTEWDIYRIKVTYDQASGIPEDAELVVRELTEETDQNYSDYLTAGTGMVGLNDTHLSDGTVSIAKAFDISIRSKSTGEEYQPSNDMAVEISLPSYKLTDEMQVGVVHFAEKPSEEQQAQLRQEAYDSFSEEEREVYDNLAEGQRDAYISLSEEERGVYANLADEEREVYAALPGDKRVEYTELPEEERRDFAGSLDAAAVVDPAAVLDAELLEALNSVPQVMEVERVSNTASFVTAGFSVFVVLGYTVDSYYRDCEGNTWHITAEYSAEAGLPAGVELVVNELPEGTEAYDSYVQRTAETLGKETEHFAFARAFDISLVNPETGEHCQPNQNVKVSIELMNEDVGSGDDVSVVHFKGDVHGEATDGAKTGEAYTENLSEEERKAIQEAVGSADTEVMEAYVVDGALEFETDGFSVYVVIKDQPTRTYHFVKTTDYTTVNGKTVWTDEYTQYRQILTNGDKLVRPSNPAVEGRDFQGWKLATVDGEGNVSVAADHVADTYWGTTVSGLTNTTDDDGNVVVTNEDVILVADFGTERCKVTYYDQNNSVVHMVYVDKGASISPNNKSAADYQGYTPIQNIDGSFLVFEHWTLQPYGDKSAAGTLTVNENISLYPIVLEAHHIYFDGNSSAINDANTSYTGSITVQPHSLPDAKENAEDTEYDYDPAKIIPTAKGYVFAGWYIVSDNSRDDNDLKVFNADGSLNQAGWNSLKTKSSDVGITYDPTLYAHWTFSDTPVKYSVVYYAQKSTCEAGVTPTEDDYEFVKADMTVRTAQPGTPINRDSLGKTEAQFLEDAFTQDTVGSFYAKDRQGFELSAVNNPTVTVSGDGSTVLRVYLDRKTFTMTFSYTTGLVSFDSTHQARNQNIHFANGQTGNTIIALYGHVFKDYFPIAYSQQERTGTETWSSVRWGSWSTVNYSTSSWDDPTHSVFTAIFATTDSMPAQNLTVDLVNYRQASKVNLYYLEVVDPAEKNYR